MNPSELLAAIQSALDAGDHARAFELSRRLVGALKPLARAVNPQDVNYEGVPDGHIRRVAEAPFVAAKRELDECFYQHWRYGRSKPFRGHDLEPTVDASREKHGKLSDLLDQQMAIAIDEEDQKQPKAKRIPARRKTIDGRTHREIAEERIALRAREGLTLTLR